MVDIASNIDFKNGGGLLGVSLRFLSDFASKVPADYSTGKIVDEYVIPSCRTTGLPYIAQIPARYVGPVAHYVIHAWSCCFLSDLVVPLLQHFIGDSGTDPAVRAATLSNTFVWLDCFSCPQPPPPPPHPLPLPHATITVGTTSVIGHVSLASGTPSPASATTTTTTSSPPKLYSVTISEITPYEEEPADNKGTHQPTPPQPPPPPTQPPACSSSNLLCHANTTSNTANSNLEHLQHGHQQKTQDLRLPVSDRLALVDCVLRRCSSVLLLLDSCGTALGRTWCLYEVARTLQLRGPAALHVPLFEFALDAVHEALQGINLAASQAHSSEDRRGLLDTLTEDFAEEAPAEAAAGAEAAAAAAAGAGPEEGGGGAGREVADTVPPRLIGPLGAASRFITAGIQDALIGEAQQLIRAGCRSGRRYLACLRKAAEALRLGGTELAEALALAALKEHWRLLGEAAGPSLAALSNLALLRRRQGRAAEAEQLMRQVLEGRRAVLGSEHPDTAAACDQLAWLLQGQGRLAEAAEMYQQALDISRAALGPEHPDTLAACSNLAGALGALGRLGEAEQLLTWSLEVATRTRGERHPQTAACHSSLGMLYRARGQSAKAREHFEAAYNTTRTSATLGADHENTVSACQNTALALKAEGRMQGAEQVVLQAKEEMGCAEEAKTTQRLVPSGHAAPASPPKPPQPRDPSQQPRPHPHRHLPHEQTEQQQQPLLLQHPELQQPEEQKHKHSPSRSQQQQPEDQQQQHSIATTPQLDARPVVSAASSLQADPTGLTLTSPPDLPCRDPSSRAASGLSAANPTTFATTSSLPPTATTSNKGNATAAVARTAVQGRVIPDSRCGLLVQGVGAKSAVSRPAANAAQHEVATPGASTLTNNRSSSSSGGSGNDASSPAVGATTGTAASSTASAADDGAADRTPAGMNCYCRNVKGDSAEDPKAAAVAAKVATAGGIISSKTNTISTSQPTSPPSSSALSTSPDGASEITSTPQPPQQQQQQQCPPQASAAIPVAAATWAKARNNGAGDHADTEAAAAIKIQSYHRGRQARKQVAQMRRPASAGAAATPLAAVATPQPPAAAAAAEALLPLTGPSPLPPLPRAQGQRRHALPGLPPALPLPGQQEVQQPAEQQQRPAEHPPSPQVRSDLPSAGAKDERVVATRGGSTSSERGEQDEAAAAAAARSHRSSRRQNSDKRRAPSRDLAAAPIAAPVAAAMAGLAAAAAALPPMQPAPSISQQELQAQQSTPQNTSAPQPVSPVSTTKPVPPTPLAPASCVVRRPLSRNAAIVQARELLLRGNSGGSVVTPSSSSGGGGLVPDRQENERRRRSTSPTIGNEDAFAPRITLQDYFRSSEPTLRALRTSQGTDAAPNGAARSCISSTGSGETARLQATSLLPGVSAAAAAAEMPRLAKPVNVAAIAIPCYSPDGLVGLHADMLGSALSQLRLMRARDNVVRSGAEARAALQLKLQCIREAVKHALAAADDAKCSRRSQEQLPPQPPQPPVPPPASTAGSLRRPIRRTVSGASKASVLPPVHRRTMSAQVASSEGQQPSCGRSTVCEDDVQALMTELTDLRMLLVTTTSALSAAHRALYQDRSSWQVLSAELLDLQRKLAASMASVLSPGAMAPRPEAAYSLSPSNPEPSPFASNTTGSGNNRHRSHVTSAWS